MKRILTKSWLEVFHGPLRGTNTLPEHRLPRGRGIKELIEQDIETGLRVSRTFQLVRYDVSEFLLLASAVSVALHLRFLR